MSILSSDIQPLQNLCVLQKIAADFKEDKENPIEYKIRWAKYWIIRGFKGKNYYIYLFFYELFFV